MSVIVDKDRENENYYRLYIQYSEKLRVSKEELKQLKITIEKILEKDLTD
jgi:hypothetical protein